MSRILLSPSQYVQGKGELARLAQYILPLGQKPFVLISASGQKRFGESIERSFNGAITFDFHQGTTAALIKELKEEKIDAALCSSVENEPDVLFYPVAEEELVVAVPKGHPLSNRGSVSLKELEPYPLIAFDKSSGLNEMINKLLDQAQVHLKTACHVEEDNAMAGFVAAGYGVAILPDFYTLQYYNLDRIPIADSFERRYLFLALLRQSQVLPVVERFRNFLLSRWQRGAI